MNLEGPVVKGEGCAEKVPTANIALDKPVEVGCYRGIAYAGADKLGDAAVWVMPHQPFIAEAYISGYEGDLYDTYLTIQNMTKLNREDLKGLYDKALA